MRPVLESYFRLTELKRGQVVGLSLLALVTGALNIGLVSMISSALQREIASISAYHVLGYTFVACAYVYALAILEGRTTALSERAVASARLKLVNALLDASLQRAEYLQLHRKQSAVTRDVATVAAGLPILVTVIASLSTVACGAAYLFWLHPAAASTVVMLGGLGVVYFEVAMRRLGAQLSAAVDLEDEFLRGANGLFQGAKELKLDANFAAMFRTKVLTETAQGAAQAMEHVKVRQRTVALVSVVSFLAAIGVVTFASDLFGSFGPQLASSFVVTLLFLNFPLQSAVLRMPALAETTAAVRRLVQIFDVLPSEFSGRAASAAEGSSAREWSRIAVENVSFSYTTDLKQQRTLTEVNVDFNRGTLTFIVGGNGSGKTTLTKILMGLYEPSSGRVTVDGIDVKNQIEHYRSMFTSVSSDSYLFDRHFNTFSEAERAMLRRIGSELQIPVQWNASGHLNTSALSQGQRKRLALAISLLTPKDLHCYDEWTADQDPEFRAYFYNVFLPRLRAQGKTVIVVTHDERFHTLADVVVVMHEGTIATIRRSC